MPDAKSPPSAGSPDLAVLTGDIVRSTRLGPGALDAAMATLADAAGETARWQSGTDARFTRFRGDGWQCLAPSPQLALRAVLYLRARLRALDRDIDTRVAVGIGSGTLPATGDLSAATGPAFEIAGRGLDRMARVQQLAVGWAEPPPAAGIIGAVYALVDEISRLWTPRQAEVLVESLSPGDERQKELAAQIGVSQQAIAKRLSGGGDWAIQRALAALEGAA